MALVLKDRISETTTTTGTGTITLAGATAGFQAFSTIGDGNTTYYCITDGSDWEVGLGTYTSSGNTLARTTVYSNSSGNTSPITLGAGTKNVFGVFPADGVVVVNGTTIQVPGNAVLPIANGGTGSNTATFSGANITSINANNISSGVLAVAQGGTGSSTASFSGANITSLNASAISSGTIGNSYTTASSSNGASTIVARDASGNFSANTITANLSGNASTATSATSATTAGSAGTSNAASAQWVSAAIAGSTSTGNQVSVEIRNNGGTGDGNVAAQSFHCQNYYGAHQHLRADGYFGVGGWSASAWRWYVNLTNGDMTAAGNVTAYSDVRLKENIIPLKNSLDKVCSLNGVRFTWKNLPDVVGSPGKTDLGVLAHEVEAVAPETISASPHTSPDGDPYKTVAYDKLVPLLIEAIKELKVEIDELKRSK